MGGRGGGGGRLGSPRDGWRARWWEVPQHHAYGHFAVRCRQNVLVWLQIVHCVMYPRAEHDLPILSLDVVAKDGVVSLGIIDPCPVSMTTQLPQDYSQMVRCSCCCHPPPPPHLCSLLFATDTIVSRRRQVQRVALIQMWLDWVACMEGGTSGLVHPLSHCTPVTGSALYTAG